MKFTGFSSGCVGKALTVILCILLGMIIAIGGEALAGYILLTRDGMVGYVADKVNGDSEKPTLVFDDETKSKSILAWGQEIMTAVGDLSNQEIGSLEKLIGMSIISDTVSDAMGVDAEKIKASTLNNIGETVSNNLTLNTAQDKFKIALPKDIPLFSDEEFLAKPLSEAFEGFTDHKLSDFINVTDDTNSVLKELSGVSISELQGKAGDEKIKSMCLGQIMTIDASSSKILKALKDCCIESQWTDETKTAYKTKEITEIIDGEKVTRTVELMGINERIETLLVSEVVDINDDSNVILRKMRDEGLKITELGGKKVTDLVNDTKIGEIITINTEGADKSEPIMIALKDVKISGLNDKMKTLKINEIFAEEKLATGALSLIPADTVISDIPSEMTKIMQSATTATLKGKGLINADLSTLDNPSKFKKEQKAFILNSNVGQMMEGLIEFVADPIDPTVMPPKPKYSHIAPDQRTINETSFSSLTAFVAAYRQFETVTFASDVTVTIDAAADAGLLKEIGGVEYYCIPVFNGIADTAVTITFNGGDVRLAVYDTATDAEGNVTRTLSRSQYAYAYFTNVTEIAGAYATVGEIAANELGR
mgnify:FL=1